MTNKISKNSPNEKNVLGVYLENSKKVLPLEPIIKTLNYDDVCNSERLSCHNIRLNCAVNVIASNVLFNPFTEIVQNEGSDTAKCFNYQFIEQDDIKPKYKSYDDFKGDDLPSQQYNLIDDTQLSSFKYGNLVYHCGLDFFNNHILRSNTFKCVNKLNSGTDKNFNTILDYHRHYDGSNINDDTILFKDTDKVHLYKYDNLMTFDKTIEERLIERNGWFGFVNKGRLKIYEDKELLDISKPINNKETCEFVDMYPTRELFSFAPLYNNFRHRIERNWNYCLTYPSSSTTENIPFIVQNSNSLRIFLIEDDGGSSVKVHTMSKHGLKIGDQVNLYKKEEDSANHSLFANSLKVTKVVDDYSFFLNINNIDLGGEYRVTENAIEVHTPSTRYKFKRNKFYFYDTQSDFLTYSFKKVINGKEVSYYVRIFSRIPNWKGVDRKITSKVIYDSTEDNNISTEDNNNIIEGYQFTDDNGGQFTHHIGKLAFAKNIYNDSIGEVVYTDDICFDFLKDNLGRPLHEVYFTIVKNNKGYKTWYEESLPNSEDVEFSHCFNKVTCGFYLSPLMYDKNVEQSLDYVLHNTRVLCDKPNYGGLDMSKINNDRGQNVADDEVDFYHDRNYYGDLCSYSTESCKEEIIQQCDLRFNTYIREKNTSTTLKYSEIKKDDYDSNGNYSSDEDFIKCFAIPIGPLFEGYYYSPHNIIPLKSIANEIVEVECYNHEIRTFKELEPYTSYRFTTFDSHDLNEGDMIKIVNNNDNIIFEFVVQKINSFRCFDAKSIDNTNNLDKNYLAKEIDNIRIVHPKTKIPYYADFIADKSVFRWRDIIQNGFENTLEYNIEDYQFANNAFYVSKNINLYLRRQDPLGKSMLTNRMYDKYNIVGKEISSDIINTVDMSDGDPCDELIGKVKNYFQDTWTKA